MLSAPLLPALAASMPLRIMTFNVWSAPDHINDALSKVAKHILLVNPDVVALQEVRNCIVLDEITRMLGPGWSSVCNAGYGYSDVAIVSRHQITHNSLAGFDKVIGVEIRLGCGKMFNIWSAHFDGDRYGPDAISYGMVTTKKQIAAGEKRREQQVMQVREDTTMQKLISSCTVPIFFAGDFNSPSHLDWVESTQQLHGGWTFEWPATKILEDMGFRDSFRKLHPDPLKEPGITWSTVYKFKERSRNTIPAPQDRLDFILYKGRAKPVKSFIYCGNEKLIPMPNQWNNDYPSDHYAVVTDFELY